MKRILLVCGLAAVFGLLSFRVTKAFQVQSPTRHAFTITVVSESPPPNPNVEQYAPRRMRRMMAFRSDGSSVTATLPAQEADGINPSFFGDRYVYLRSDRTQVYVLDQLKLKSTTVMSGDGPVKQLPPLDPKCGGTSHAVKRFLRMDQYEGYDVYVYERTFPGTPGNLDTETQWVTPLLDCLSLQSTLDRKESGEIKHFHNYVNSIVVGEPDPKLFNVPQDYREVSPSQMETERAVALGRSLPPGAAETMKFKDDRYWKSSRH
jgi:hypothetical protein